SKTDLERQAQVWSDHLTRFSLCLNVRKMEYLMINPNEYGMIQMDGIYLSRTEKFKYLCYMITADRSPSHKVISRINSAWLHQASDIKYHV
ncbi:hypothetical protein JRQ81_012318, partial [Phrynocephalus forsythii]